ncbi:MAG: hypothetical protein EP343_24000 [Deltaproteobacteria bacterium]|nr:MAG: hypothetical protein EP343_24000 [Deltaproteobacteria bacterium]
MKLWTAISAFALSVVFAAPQAADASYCPRSSNGSRATTNSKCRCRTGNRSATLTFKYKRKRSLSSSKVKRWAVARAKSSALKNCKKYGSWAKLTYAHVSRWRNKNTLGFNSGYVVLKYRCTWRQVKRSLVKKLRPYLSKRVYSSNGTTTYKKKGIRLSKVSACGRADSAAKSWIAKKHRAKVTWYKRRGYSYKKTPFYLRCTVKWSAKYRKWHQGARRFYYCW